MRRLILAIGVLLAGCGTEENVVVDLSPPSEGETHDHSHEGDEVLFWQRESIEHGGYLISLGHQGIHVYEGHAIQPAVTITKDGQPVGEAKVFSTLLAADGKTLLAEETRATFAAADGNEPAHYVAEKLAVPGNVAEVVVRYRITFSADVPDFQQDVLISVEEH